MSRGRRACPFPQERAGERERGSPESTDEDSGTGSSGSKDGSTPVGSMYRKTRRHRDGEREPGSKRKPRSPSTSAPRDRHDRRVDSEGDLKAAARRDGSKKQVRQAPEGGSVGAGSPGSRSRTDDDVGRWSEESDGEPEPFIFTKDDSPRVIAESEVADLARQVLMASWGPACAAGGGGGGSAFTEGCVPTTGPR